MRLTDLLENPASLSGDIGALDINGLAVNSAQVKPGNLFFALPGTVHDGRDFICDAITRGAVAILTDDRPHKLNKSLSVPVVQASNPRQVMAKAAARFWPEQPSLIGAVTGTNGKTSTVDFMRQIWARVNWSSMSIGTIGVRGDVINNADTPFADITQLTTPNSLVKHPCSRLYQSQP